MLPQRRIPCAQGLGSIPRRLLPIQPPNHLWALQARHRSSGAEIQPNLRTTRPAPLDVPVRQPGQGVLGHLYATGKAYLVFYRTGLRHVFLNYRTARAIERSLRDQQMTVDQAIQAGRLTRTQFQLLHRNRHDIRRVPLFALVCLCCGELTPLVVFLLANQVPWTCWTPQQVQKHRRRQAGAQLRREGPPPRDENLVRVCRAIGLQGRWWRPPAVILQRRLHRHVQYLETDDQLIRSCKTGPSEWPLAEVEWALMDRGIGVAGESKEALREALDRWLVDRQDHSVRDLLQRG